MTDKPKSKVESADIIAARDRLAPFLGANEGVAVTELQVRGEQRLAVEHPWNDKSLALFIPPENPDTFYEAMNQLILPERFTAIYHIDTKKFEVIWTAYQLPEDQKDLAGRNFKFNYDGKSHKCHFTRSSDRLLTIASSVVPLGMSASSFRNLQSFDFYTRPSKDGSKPHPSIAEPYSFWIEDLDFHPEKTVELINNLNFYPSYFDNKSPNVVLHQIAVDSKPHPRLRYVSGKFPTTISGKKLDNTLLSFWEASAHGDAARRFQYYYRIIEYASFFYLESSARIAVRRILSAPDAADDIGCTTDKLMSAFSMSKLDDFARFAQLMQDTIDPKLLWSEIKGNLAAFSKDYKCDGGYTIKALVSATAKESSFAPKGVELFTKAIRDIRNALSHGRDFRSATVITPTLRNLKALQPWVHLIAIAAGQVVLHKDIA